MRVLLEYSWPGNVRELENAVERARICSRGEVIEESALPAEIRRGGGTPHWKARPAGRGPAEPEEGMIREALARSRGNRGEAAAQLGISRVTLWRRMKQLDGSP
jgi:DNA-binding NtrC family response regulator